MGLAPHRDGPNEHKAIVQAVLAREADRAVAVLDSHFAGTARILMQGYHCRTPNGGVARRPQAAEARDSGPAGTLSERAAWTVEHAAQHTLVIILQLRE